MIALPYVYDDGGRGGAGFKGNAGDCVTRAIAIATGLPYLDVYEELSRGMGGRALTRGRTSPRSARDGVLRPVYDAMLTRLGWEWTPTMRIGSGTTVHLRQGEIPEDGPVVARLSRHLCAVIDGVIHDTSDPSREGTRAVYGYWYPAVPR